MTLRLRIQNQPMTFVGLALAASLLIATVGCDNAPPPPQEFDSPVLTSDSNEKSNIRSYDGSPSGGQTGLETGTSKPVSRSWAVEDIKIACRSKPCLPGVGVVFLMAPLDDTRVMLTRCTGFIVDGQRVVTAGHCYTADQNLGYLVLPSQQINGKPTVVKLGPKVFSTFTPSTKEEPLPKPDIAVFNLEKVDSRLPFLQMVKAQELEKIETSELWASVVNPASPDDETGAYFLDQISCPAPGHNYYFPIKLNERPETMRLFGCAAHPGNSGSPIIDPKSGQVIALLPAGLHDAAPPFVDGTLLNCVSGLGDSDTPCLKVDNALLTKRKMEKFAELRESINSYVPQHPVTNEFHLKKFIYPLAQPPTGTLSAIEIFYFPTCRRSQGPITEFQFLTERIDFLVDDKLQLVAQSGEQRLSKAKVINSQDTNFEIEVEWQKPFGTLKLTRPDFRELHPKSFWIALPICTS